MNIDLCLAVTCFFSIFVPAVFFCFLGGFLGCWASCLTQECQSRAKSPMKLVLNPKGKIWDINAMRNSGLVYEPPPLSPEVCSNLVKDLNTQKGKGKRANKHLPPSVYTDPIMFAPDMNIHRSSLFQF